MDPLLLIGSIIVVAVVLTWILPAGQFDRKTDPETHRTVVVPGPYKSVARHPVGAWGTLMSVPQGLVEAGEVVFFVLLAGGALTVVEGTGAFRNLLNHLMARFGDRPLLVLGLASILFLVGGASNNMYNVRPRRACCSRFCNGQSTKSHKVQQVWAKKR
jgi:uncharacterized ion transporter superfamily protein YfcC